MSCWRQPARLVDRVLPSWIVLFDVRPMWPQEYGEQALQQLRAEFRTVSVSVLRQVLTLHGFRYSPAVYQLARCRHLHDLKSKRYTTPSKPKDLQLLEEVTKKKKETISSFQGSNVDVIR